MIPRRDTAKVPPVELTKLPGPGGDWEAWLQARRDWAESHGGWPDGGESGLLWGEAEAWLAGCTWVKR